jgi:hypothetical protein
MQYPISNDNGHSVKKDRHGRYPARTFWHMLLYFFIRDRKLFIQAGILPYPVGNDFRNIPKGIIIICFPGILSSDFIRGDVRTRWASRKPLKL